MKTKHNTPLIKVKFLFFQGHNNKKNNNYEPLITLDKIKIIAPIESIRSLQEEYFKVEIKNSEIVSYSFTQNTPFLLYIEKDIEEQE